MAVISNEHLQVALSIGSSLGIFGETEPLQTLIICLGCLAPMDTIAYNDKKVQVVFWSNGAWATEPKRMILSG